MKKLFLIVILFAFFVFLSYGENNENEEIGFFIFQPDSIDRFINHNQEMIRLDNMAADILSRDVFPGQIII